MVAGVVAKSIVPGRALFVTVLSVVTFVADEPVRISQLCLFSSLHILRPVGADTQLSLDGEKANQKVWVVRI